MTTILPAGTFADLESKVDILDGLLDDIQFPSSDAPNHIVVTADMTSATWNTVASHEILTVTGPVGLRIWAYCTGTLTDATDTATIQLGIAGTTNAIIGATDAAGLNGQTLTAGQFWYDTSPDSAIAAFDTAVIEKVIPNGLDIGYEIAGEALTGGTIEFHCVWWPLQASATVVAGAGGTL